MTTILVVDDEFLIADVISFALEDEGYEVVRASNGRKALDVLDRERPDLIITDFMMPVMNGLEFARILRDRADGVGLPVILMSGAQAAIARQHNDMFQAVFDKPFMVDQLLAKVVELAGPPD